jgi:hypothetical protein
MTGFHHFVIYMWYRVILELSALVCKQTSISEATLLSNELETLEILEVISREESGEQRRRSELCYCRSIRHNGLSKTGYDK